MARLLNLRNLAVGPPAGFLSREDNAFDDPDKDQTEPLDLDPRLDRNVRNISDILMGKKFYALIYDNFVPDLNTAREEIRAV